MKKKSLLILPVLLLALAACNKEEEVVEPEDDDTVTTEPSGDQEPGGDGGNQGGENIPEIDARVSVTKDAVSFEEAPSVTFQNESNLVIASVVEDEDSGDITYYLEGSASVMSADQAAVFWNGVAKAGDKYIIVTISLEADETASWTASDSQPKTAPSTEDIVIRISGQRVSEDKLAGTATYTITDAAGEEVNHIVDFSALFDTRITLGTGTLGSSTYENDPSLSIASVKTDESGNITYVLSGKAGEMTSDQANDFWPEVAAAGNLFIVVTVTLKEGESVSANSSTPITYEECQGSENYIVRLTGTSTSGATSIVFTITDSTSGTVTHTIDFSALLPEVEEE